MKMTIRLFAVLAIALPLFLTGCGGGGGGSDPPTVSAATITPVITPAPATVTVTCPNGASSTAATTGAANAACPAAKVLSTSVAQNGVVSPDTFQIVVKTSGDIDLKTLTDANITLWAGTAGVPGNAVKITITPGDKMFTITTPTKLNYGQAAYILTVKNVVDTLGRPIPVDDLTFSTTAMVCTDLTVWSADHNTCVAPLGVQTVGVNQLQDSSCVSTEWGWDKACFISAVRNGTVKVANTTATANSKPLIFALFADIDGVSIILPFDVSDPKNPVPVGGNILGGLSGKINWVIGNPTAILVSLVGTGNYQFHWDTTSKTFVYVKL